MFFFWLGVFALLKKLVDKLVGKLISEILMLIFIIYILFYYTSKIKKASLREFFSFS
jgi:hypothetical protein